MCSIASGLRCWDATTQAASDDAPSQRRGWRGVLSFSFEVCMRQGRVTLPCESLRGVRAPNIASVVPPAKLEVSPDFPAVGAREAGSVGHIISIPDKWSLEIYRMLCQNQRRRGYYHDVPSESSDGLVGLARAWSSLNVLLPQLVNQLLHVEGIPRSKFSCRSHVVDRSCSVSVVLRRFYLSVAIHP